MGIGEIVITRKILRYIDYSFSVSRRIASSCSSVARRASRTARVEFMGISTADFSTTHRAKERSNTGNGSCYYDQVCFDI